MVLRGNERVTYRIATEKDVVDYWGAPSPYTIKAVAFFLDDVVSGLAGWKFENGRFVIFSDIGKDVDVPRQTIWRCAKVVMSLIREKKTPMYAVAHNKDFCEKLGFKHLDGETYTWQS